MRRILGALLVGGLVLGVVLGVGPTIRGGGEPDVAPTYESMPTPQAISLFQGRVEANEGDAVSATILGELFSRRARETGDFSQLERAEASLDRALTTLPNYPRAEAALADVYVAQHRFVEALDLALKAHEADPGGGAIITVGDAQLALGRYDDARSSYLEALDLLPAPLISARLAHIDEIHGDLPGARATLDKAAVTYMEAGGSGEPAAWFQMRRGDLAFASGDYPGARAAYEASLEILPNYPGSLAGLGRSLEALGDREAAIAAYEGAVEAQPLPATLLALGELYELDGRAADAQIAFDTIAVISDLSDGLFDLSMVFYEADHGDPEIAVAIAKSLVDARPDLYSYDALAWASYRAGDLEAARAASDEAVATNPSVATIWFHSGVIWLGLGSDDLAVSDLEQAVGLSPHFDPIRAVEATQLLEVLAQ